MKLNNTVLAVMLMTSTVIAGKAIAEEKPVEATVNPITPGNQIPLPAGDAQEGSEPAVAPASDATFTSEQKELIGEAAKDYLLAHPETLIEVSQKLNTQMQKQQIKAMTAAAINHQDALLYDKSTPAYGPADAKVVFIEFFDYQCKVCAGQAPVIESIMKDNPQVRYVFKQWPIFAQRWEPSLTAAKTGLQIWQQKGADEYLAYHNAIFATGHDEGLLRQEDIDKSSAPSGKLKNNNDEILDILTRTDALAMSLGFRGTPGMIVMPAHGATVDNVTIIPGGADSGALTAAIDKASGE